MKCNVISRGIIDPDATYQGWPTVLLTRNNTLVVGCSGDRLGHVCPYGRAQIYRSEDFGKTWEGPQKISNGPLDDRDVGLCQAADGSIFAGYFTSVFGFYWCDDDNEISDKVTIKDMKDNLGFWARRSFDDGKTWTERFSIPVFSCHGPTLLSDGTMLYAGPEHPKKYVSILGGMAKRASTSVARSTDNGQTWELIAKIPIPEDQTAEKMCEMHMVEAADGTIIMHIRNHNGGYGTIWQCESKDKGVTWTVPHYVSCGFPSFLTRLSDGRLMMSVSWREVPYGIRARISEDNGKTWGEEIILHDTAEFADLGYPTTMELPDHTFFTVWYEYIGIAYHPDGVAYSKSILRYLNWSLS